MIIGTNFAAFGYRKGRSSVRSILGSGKIQQLLTAASALGILYDGCIYHQHMLKIVYTTSVHIW